MVETCIKDLEALLGDPPATSYMSKAGSDIQDHLFMGQHVVKTSKHKFSTAKNQFIQTVIDNINKRYLKYIVTCIHVFSSAYLTFKVCLDKS